jgi:hypothetical protein
MTVLMPNVCEKRKPFESVALTVNSWYPSAPGVPDIAPEEFIDRPLGNFPAEPEAVVQE